MIKVIGILLDTALIVCCSARAFLKTYFCVLFYISFRRHGGMTCYVFPIRY